MLAAGVPAALARAITFVRIADEGNGAPEEIRTPDPQIRSLVLYPAELRVRFEGANLFISLPKGKNNRASPGRALPHLLISSQVSVETCQFPP